MRATVIRDRHTLMVRWCGIARHLSIVVATHPVPANGAGRERVYAVVVVVVLIVVPSGWVIVVVVVQVVVVRTPGPRTLST